jgi:hypothetical protein
LLPLRFLQPETHLAPLSPTSLEGAGVQSLPAGGFWAKFVCPRRGGNAQRLRLLDDRPACGKCVRASGLIYRSQSVRTEKRHLVTAPVRVEKLNQGGLFRDAEG